MRFFMSRAESDSPEQFDSGSFPVKLGAEPHAPFVEIPKNFKIKCDPINQAFKFILDGLPSGRKEECDYFPKLHVTVDDLYLNQKVISVIVDTISQYCSENGIIAFKFFLPEQYLEALRADMSNAVTIYFGDIPATTVLAFAKILNARLVNANAPVVHFSQTGIQRKMKSCFLLKDMQYVTLTPARFGQKNQYWLSRYHELMKSYKASGLICNFSNDGTLTPSTNLDSLKHLASSYSPTYNDQSYFFSTTITGICVNLFLNQCDAFKTPLEKKTAHDNARAQILKLFTIEEIGCYIEYYVSCYCFTFNLEQQLVFTKDIERIINSTDENRLSVVDAVLTMVCALYALQNIQNILLSTEHKTRRYMVCRFLAGMDLFRDHCPVIMHKFDELLEKLCCYISSYNNQRHGKKAPLALSKDLIDRIDMPLIHKFLEAYGASIATMSKADVQMIKAGKFFQCAKQHAPEAGSLKCHLFGIDRLSCEHEAILSQEFYQQFPTIAMQLNCC